MKPDIVLKFAASALVLGIAMVGCTPQGTEHPATLSSVAPRVDTGKAAHAAGAAMLALSRHKPDKAVTAAETAVALSPLDAVYRALLGQAYMADGRFRSAETSFQDSLTLSPDDNRTAMNLVVARIALGKWDMARAELAALKGKVGETDRGLALALAGDPAGAVDALEAAARVPGAGAKTRQNLALAYALDGRWAEARTMAAQDLEGAALDQRMREWAVLSQPKSASDQVASLLHITPVEDPGQPTRLALAPAVGEAPRALAAARPIVPIAPAVPVVPAPEAPVLVQPAPAQVAEAAPPMDIVRAAPAEQAAVAQAAPVPAAFTEQPAREPMVYAEAAPAAPSGAAERARPFLIAARHPARIPLNRAEPQPRLVQRSRGKYVVQLGSYSSAARVEAGWNRQLSRLSMLGGYTPSGATFRRTGATFYRLTLSGFETRGEAVKLCEALRARGGQCFVRSAAGEQPIQWAARKRGVAFASR